MYIFTKITGGIKNTFCFLQASGLSCLKCGRSFTQKGSLRRHDQDVHQKIKRFQCSFCKVLFSQSWHLRYHIKMKHSSMLQIDQVYSVPNMP